MTDIPLGDLALNFGVSALAVLVFIAVVMAVAIRMNNHSIIDICWGPGFAVVAAVMYFSRNVNWYDNPSPGEQTN